MHCNQCGRTKCHLMPIRVYIYDPPKVQSFYTMKEWCMNCVVSEAIASKFKGKGPLDKIRA